MEAGAIGQVVCRAEKWVNCCYANLRIIFSIFILVLLAGLTGFAGADTLYVYDAAGRLTGVTNSVGDGAQYRYDMAGNLIAIEASTSGQLVFGQLMPDAGPVGSSITISGSGFSATPAGNSVTFNGISATVTSASADRLAVTVPTGASTGPVTVTVGTATVKSPRPFTVTEGPLNQAPQIVSFTPGIGLARTSVTITGQNFNSSSTIVSFNGAGAAVGVATAMQIDTQVPTVATSGPIKISTPFGEAISGSDFIVPPKGYTEAQIGVTGRIAVDGNPQTFSGLGASGKIGLILFDGVKGQSLGLGISPVTFTAGSSVTLYIKTPTGADLVNATSLSSGSKIAIPALPFSGTYSIMVVPATASTALNATFSLSSDVMGTLVDGVVETFTTARVGQNGRYTFNAGAGESLRLLWSGSTIQGLYSYIYIYKPDGTLLVNTTFSHIENLANGGAANGVIELLDLPVMGTYTVFVYPYQVSTGSVNLQLHRNVTADLMVDGPPLNTALVAGQVGEYHFNGVVGQNLGLGIDGLITTSSGGRVSADIYGPDKKTVVGSCSYYSTPGGKCLLPALLVAGTYTVRIVPLGAYGATLALTLSNDVAGGILTEDVAQTFTTARVGQNGRYTFSGRMGENLSMVWTGATIPGSYSSIYVYKPDGSMLLSKIFSDSPNNANGAASGVVNLLDLPVTGAYTVLVSPYGTGTGSVNLRLQSNKKGDLVTDGPSLQTSLAVGQTGDYHFNGTVGQSLGLGIDGLMTTVSNGSVAMTVYAPNGSTVVKDCPSSTMPGGKCMLPVLPATGTYTVRVAPGALYGATGVFGATLALTLSSDIVGVLTPGGVVQTFSTTRVGQNGRYTFSAQAGENFRLAWSGTTFPNASNYIYVYSPDGKVLASQYVANVSSYVSGVINLLDLPMTGNYTVVVNPSGVNTGSVSLQLTHTGTTAPGAQTEDGSILVDAAPVTLSVSAGQTVRYIFNGTVGQNLGLGIEGLSTTLSGGKVTVEVYAPNNKTMVAYCGSYSVPGGKCVVPALPSAGSYTVRVTPAGTYGATMALSLSNDVTGILTPGGAVQTFTTARVGQNGRYIFSGRGGENLRLAWSGATFPATYNYFYVYKPDGTTLTSQLFYDVGSYASGVVSLLDLPATGMYTVVVNPSEMNIGSVNLQLQGNATGELVADGPSVVASLGNAQAGDYRFEGRLGQTLWLDVSALTTTPGGGSVKVTVYAPNGTTVLKECGSYNTPGGRCVLSVLPGTGIYTVRVTPNGLSAATFNLQLIDAHLLQ